MSDSIYYPMRTSGQHSFQNDHDAQDQETIPYMPPMVTVRLNGCFIKLLLHQLSDPLRKLIEKIAKNIPRFLSVSDLFAFYHLLGKSADFNTYTHTLTNADAVALIFQTAKREVGYGVFEKDAIFELLSCVDSMEVSHNQSQRNQSAYYEFSRKKEELLADLSNFIAVSSQNQRQKRQLNQSKSLKLMNIVLKSCKNLGRKVIQASIIGIVSKNQQQDYLIFEQAYPIKSASKVFLLKLLGEQAYEQKKISYYRLMRQSYQIGSFNKNILICHKCKNMISKEYLICSRAKPPIIKRNSMNCPEQYLSKILKCDYNIDPQSFKVPLRENLDYFKYFKPKNWLNRACNRMLCYQCAAISLKAGEITEKKYICQFCTQKCTCKLCLMYFRLVPLLSQYLRLLNQNQQSPQQYNSLIKWVNFDNPELKTEPFIRRQFADQKYYFQSKYEKFEKQLRESYELHIKFNRKILPNSSKRLSKLSVNDHFRYYEAFQRENDILIQKFQERCTAKKSLADIKEYNKRKNRRERFNYIGDDEKIRIQPVMFEDPQTLQSQISKLISSNIFIPTETSIPYNQDKLIQTVKFFDSKLDKVILQINQLCRKNILLPIQDTKYLYAFYPKFLLYKQDPQSPLFQEEFSSIHDDSENEIQFQEDEEEVNNIQIYSVEQSPSVKEIKPKRQLIKPILGRQTRSGRNLLPKKSSSLSSSEEKQSSSLVIKPIIGRQTLPRRNVLPEKPPSSQSSSSSSEEENQSSESSESSSSIKVYQPNKKPAKNSPKKKLSKKQTLARKKQQKSPKYIVIESGSSIKAQSDHVPQQQSSYS